MAISGWGLLDSSDDTHFAVTTGSGRYVATLHAAGKCRDAVDDRLRVAVHLADQGIPVPRVVPAADHRLSVMSDEALISVSTFVDGIELATSAPAQEDVAAVAELLAGIHLSTVPVEVNTHDCWPVAMLDIPGRDWLDRLAEQDRPMAGRAADLLDSVGWAKLPRGLVHGDLHRRNVLRDGSGMLWIVDLACAGEDVLAKDLAVFIAMFCADVGRQAHPLDMIAVATDAYRRVRPLTSAELDALPALVAAVYLVYLIELSSGLQPADPERWLSFSRLNLAATVGSTYSDA